MVGRVFDRGARVRHLDGPGKDGSGCPFRDRRGLVGRSSLPVRPAPLLPVAAGSESRVEWDITGAHLTDPLLCSYRGQLFNPRPRYREQPPLPAFPGGMSILPAGSTARKRAVRSGGGGWLPFNKINASHPVLSRGPSHISYWELTSLPSPGQRKTLGWSGT